VAFICDRNRQDQNQLVLVLLLLFWRFFIVVVLEVLLQKVGERRKTIQKLQQVEIACFQASVNILMQKSCTKYHFPYFFSPFFLDEVVNQ